MRLFAAASLLSVAFGQSQATTTALINAVQACSQSLSAAFQNNQQCSSTLSTVATFATPNTVPDLAPFCSSVCFGKIRNAYVAFGNCMQAYGPSLEAGLRADNVSNPVLTARIMMSAYNNVAKSFDFFCLKNERGDYCYPLFSKFSANIAATNGSSVLDAVCGGFYNMGCCLPSLASLYSDTVQIASGTNETFLTSLTSSCPVLANYNPPVCPGFGQRALALSVSMSLTGLTCSAYQAQNDAFKARYIAALKLDLAAHGIDVNFITISSIVDASGVCTLKVVLRAASDAATSALSTSASTLNTASLTASNEVLASASGLGSVTAMGSASVSNTYVAGQSGSDDSSAMIAGPSMALLAAYLLLA